MTTKIGLVGYGPGGKHFHAPFINVAQGVELAGVVTRSPERAVEIRQKYAVPVYTTQAQMLAADPAIDAVAISTPPQTRRDLVIEALTAGRHVVADKPLAPSEPAGRELATLAEDAGLVLAPYYNRRWDADILTLAEVLRKGQLGTLWRVTSRFDVDEPGTIDPGPDGGLLRDLGIHLIDQMVWLLGPVNSVDAHLDLIDTPRGPTDASFAIALRHASGAASYLSGTKMNGIHERELVAYGSQGSFTARASDIGDVTSLGARPADDPDDADFETSGHWASVYMNGAHQKYPSARGSYQHFYEEFGSAVRGQGPTPVPLEGALQSIAVLDAALRSSSENRRIPL